MDHASGEDCSPLILVAGKDASGADAVETSLRCSRWRILKAAETIDALEIVKSRPVDLVLLHVPAADAASMDLPNVLRSVSPAPYLPVIILAPNPVQEHRCRFLESGADDVLSITTSADEMIARLGALLRIKRLHDQLHQSRTLLERAVRRQQKLLDKFRNHNARLQELAETDPLTGTRNVRSFDYVLDHAFKVARRYNHPLSLLALDVDRFKAINDTFGHPAGNRVLRELAAVLQQAVRESDLVARTGGEEFTAILPQADRQQAALLAERIRSAVSNFSFSGCGRTRITVSIGTASYPFDAEITTPRQMVFLADQALLLAKNGGRDQAVALGQLESSVRQRLRREYHRLQRPPQPQPVDAWRD